MLELVSRKDRQKIAKAILAKQKALFQTSVAIGKCEDCHLKDHCHFENSTDSTCRAASVAIKQFENHAYNSPLITSEDALMVRSVGAIWASIIISELFFTKYGSIAQIKGQYTFTDMHKQYLKLLERFQEGLNSLGLSPIGRKKLRSGGSETINSTLLSSYIDTEYTKKATDVAPEDTSDDGSQG